MNFKRSIICWALLFLSACGSSQEPIDSTQEPSQKPSNEPAAQTVISPGTYDRTIISGGMERKYILHIPTGYDGSGALPLVVVFHGGGMPAEAMLQATQMNDKADQENFMVAYPQGSSADNGILTWNTHLFPYPGITADDDTFVRDLLSQLESQLNVDTKRIYAAGFSNGAMMTYRLAAEFPDIFAAVAIAEGTIGLRQPDGVTWATIPDPVGPIPLLIMHGYQDPTIRYDGGQGTSMFARSVDDAIQFWTASNADNCTDTPNLPAWPSTANIQTADFTACAAGSEVELIGVGTGTHQWPTLDNNAQFAGTDAAWEFFSRHSKAN